MRRSAPRARRLFPRITLTGLLGFASSALTSLFTGGAFGWSAGADATYTIFQAGAGHANVRLSEAQRNAAVATYQRRDPDRLPRSRRRARPARHDQRRARARASASRPATADTYMLTEARYRAGIDPFLTVSTRSGPIMRRSRRWCRPSSPPRRTSSTLYQSIGGDTLLQTTPVCQPLPGDTSDYAGCCGVHALIRRVRPHNRRRRICWCCACGRRSP